MVNKKLTTVILRLKKFYNVKPEREKPFVILVHGILSTRTKDETTFPAQERLLRVAGSPEKILKLSVSEIRKLIYPVSFYKTKAKHLKMACELLVDKYDSKVPRKREEIIGIPGVGPKVAALVLAYGFGVPAIAVDSHVNQISQRLGFVKKGNDPEDTEEFLEKNLNVPERLIANHVFVPFGKDICRPIAPHCFRCPIYDFCEYDKKAYYKNRGALR